MDCGKHSNNKLALVCFILFVCLIIKTIAKATQNKILIPAHTAGSYLIKDFFHHWWLDAGIQHILKLAPT